MFVTPLLYIMCGICFAVPIAILVMTTSMGGSAEGEAEAATFTNAWQAISSLSSASSGMDLTSMCNMNLVYFAIGIFVCLFVSAEFKSGYAKNLFTYRSKKSEYVASKTVVCTAAGMIMVLLFFVGVVIGGAIAGLPFATEGFTSANLIACLIAKLFLTGIYVAIPLLAAVFVKQKVWLSVCISLVAGALLFMMIPMMTPLDAGILQPVLCLAGSAMFAFGLGVVSNIVLNKTNIL